VIGRWEPVIGLEIHAQLDTGTKMFCPCPTGFGGRPNSRTCPVCAGMPGSLPTVNRQAVEHAIRLGLALDATVHLRSVFARKNYFYPDLPKGYQISQFDRPLCTGGSVGIGSGAQRRQVRLTRIHLEEDAGNSSHQGTSSRVDLNRAGTPLAEIVSEPELRSSEEAVAWMKALRSTLRWIGVSDGNMEEGSLRCDANISVRPVGAEELGVKVEVKNVNSFRFVRQALDHEIARQIALLEAGEPVVQETRRWHARRGETVRLRGKEDADDYRYFPEPDLPPLVLDAGHVAGLTTTMPELPWARLARFCSRWSIPAQHAEVLVTDRALAAWFEEAAQAAGDDAAKVQTLARWTVSEVLRLRSEAGGGFGALRPARLVELVELVDQGRISGSSAREVLAELWRRDVDPAEVVAERGLAQVGDRERLEAEVRKVLAAHPDELARHRAGEVKLRGFLFGQVMRALRGRADPKVLGALFDELLAG
jgi:aspartyl-tRNA(Asn)/glutamyl-tRNA(Gln) amidotransferase subunit B